jgi:hypothetical protein
MGHDKFRHESVKSAHSPPSPLKHLGLIYVLIINDELYFWTNKFIEMVLVLAEIRNNFFSEMLLMDDSTQRYCNRVFYFTSQGD